MTEWFYNTAIGIGDYSSRLVRKETYKMQFLKATENFKLQI